MKYIFTMTALLLGMFAPGVYGANPPAATETPKGAVVVSQKAFEELSNGDAFLALDLFDDVLKLDPDNKSAKFGKGTALTKLGKNRDAEKIYLELIQEYPEDYSVMNNLAWIYATSEDASFRSSAKSIALARKALIIQPLNYHIWSTLSAAYYLAGEYEKAQRAAEEALKLSVEQKAPASVTKSFQEEVITRRKAVAAFSLIE